MSKSRRGQTEVKQTVPRPKESICPLTKEICTKEKCPWWSKFTINNTGQETSEGKCAVAWFPVLLIEIRQELEKIKIRLK
jgi:hypothetical protein